MDKEMANLFWVRRKPNKVIVLDKCEETGTETHFNGNSVYLHITDQEKFDAHLEKQRKLAFDYIDNQGK